MKIAYNNVKYFLLAAFLLYTTLLVGMNLERKIVNVFLGVYKLSFVLPTTFTLAWIYPSFWLGLNHSKEPEEPLQTKELFVYDLFIVFMTIYLALECIQIYKSTGGWGFLEKNALLLISPLHSFYLTSVVDLPVHGRCDCWTRFGNIVNLELYCATQFLLMRLTGGNIPVVACRRDCDFFPAYEGILSSISRKNALRVDQGTQFKWQDFDRENPFSETKYSPFNSHGEEANYDCGDVEEPVRKEEKLNTSFQSADYF